MTDRHPDTDRLAALRWFLDHNPNAEAPDLLDGIRLLLDDEGVSLPAVPEAPYDVSMDNADRSRHSPAALDRETLAKAIRNGFTHLDRRLDDGFEIYASAYDIADEIIAQLATPPTDEEKR